MKATTTICFWPNNVSKSHFMETVKPGGSERTLWSSCLIPPPHIYLFLLPPYIYLRDLSCICVFLVTAMHALSLLRCVWE